MNTKASQDGGRKISIDASWLNQGDEGGTEFHDKPAAVKGSSTKTHVVC